jgi:hypothetical protein
VTHQGGGKNYISESFRQRADSAAFFEAWVGAKLSRANLFTVHHPFTLASETGNPLGFYAHTWDLDVGIDNVNWLPVEVKSVNLSFMEPGNYPHLGLLVCSDASWQKKWPGAETVQRDFLMVSRDTGCIVWLPKGSPTTKRQQKDPSRNETYVCVAAQKCELRSFGAFINYAKEGTLAF